MLTFHGKEYPFKIGGITAGANVGVSKMSATGEVYDLKDISKFPGIYTKLDVGIALGGGVGGLRLKNENGVIMRLESRTQGLQLNVDPPVVLRSRWSNLIMYLAGAASYMLAGGFSGSCDDIARSRCDRV